MVRPAILLRVLVPKQNSTFQCVETFVGYIQAPLQFSLWREVPRWAEWNRVEFPAKKRISKAPLNLPGVFAIKLGTFCWRSGMLG